MTDPFGPYPGQLGPGQLGPGQLTQGQLAQGQPNPRQAYAAQQPPSQPTVSLVQLTGPRWLHLATGVLGFAVLLLGFAPAVELGLDSAQVATLADQGYDFGDGLSFYEGGLGLTPAFLFVAGLVAVGGAFSRSGRKPGLVVPALILGIVIEYLFTLFVGVELAVGGVVVLVLALVQLIIACVAYVWDGELLSVSRRPAVGVAPVPGMQPNQQPYVQQGWSSGGQ
ncbi:hypothetical protein EV191_109213 [Tamaricihabitans halophyticus]|uniref:Uncharacterized protein n=1 Tax=Tamaricihabitans halophyticus TaxID=1262583 RepID=A0A4R2QQR6_9PSEU|nr:DUF5336 domain-containing protein [Tamaricihabitans halophyticus]TCP49391.1 hypothetical protein EV191_109213 [Tamaricihabitans halophyticus]